MRKWEQRKLAREIFSEAADDLGVSRFEFARLLVAGDEDAFATIAATKSAAKVGDLDWERIMQIIIRIAQILITILPLII